MQKPLERQTLSSGPPVALLDKTGSKVYVTEGISEFKVKTMHQFQLVAGEESDKDALQNIKNAGPAENMEDKAEPSTSTPCGKR